MENQVIQIFILRLDNDYEVLVSCYDWSEEALKKENKHDHMYISIRSFRIRCLAKLKEVLFF